VDQSRSKSGSRLVANETRYGGDVNVKQLVDFLKGKNIKFHKYFNPFYVLLIREGA
jgi:hypothetical protein